MLWIIGSHIVAAAAGAFVAHVELKRAQFKKSVKAAAVAKADDAVAAHAEGE